MVAPVVASNKVELRNEKEGKSTSYTDTHGKWWNELFNNDSGEEVWELIVEEVWEVFV